MRHQRLVGAALALFLLAAVPAGGGVLRVTSAADAGEGSLRAAFAMARGGDRIVLAPAGAGAATIALASPLPPLRPGIAIELRAGGPDVTITGGALPLAADAGLMLEVAPGRTATLATPVTGSEGDRGLSLAGGGVLVLAGPCDYRGGTVVSDATLRLGAGGSLPAGSALTLAEGRFELGAEDAQIGQLAGNGEIALGASSLTIDQERDSMFDGPIAGTGRLTKAGKGRLVLKRDIGWTGGTVVSGGVLELAGAGPGAQIHGSIVVQGGALITPGVRLGTSPRIGPAQ